MSSLIKILGNYTFSFDSAAGGPVTGVTFKADKVENVGTTTSGTIRLELWLTTAPWNPTGSNSGYEVAVDQFASSTNGTLDPNHYYSNISASVPLKNLPPPGTYFVTLVAAEYSGADPGTDDGYMTDNAYPITTLVTVGSDGSIVNSATTMPSLSVASRSIVEGNAGTSNMTFTVTMSHAVPTAPPSRRRSSAASSHSCSK